MSKLGPEPSFPGHPDDWTDAQWDEYLAWQRAVRAEANRVHALALKIAARYGEWAERIEARRPNRLSRYFRRKQQENLAIADEWDVES